MPTDITQADEVRRLQSDLLRLLKPGNLSDKLRELLPGRPNCQTQVLQIRTRIREINPRASLYESFGGPMP